MPKVSLEIKDSDFERLSGVAKKIGVTVETLCQQELDDALTNAVCWLERSEL